MLTVRYFRKNSLTDISRVAPPFETRTAVASSVISTGFMSEMGLAVTKLPESTATFRIWVLANHLSISTIAVSLEVWLEQFLERALSKVCSKVLKVTAPPTWRVPVSSKETSRSSGTRLGQRITGYSWFLNFVSMPTSVFPATTFAWGCSDLASNRASKLLGANHITRSPSTLNAGLVLRSFSKVFIFSDSSGTGGAVPFVTAFIASSTVFVEEHTSALPSFSADWQEPFS
mmetsp:Transcript_75814/g.158037  ORF Transcript_75814/g.158037 Transcript_75814/m.158037 type:complete len:231 (-) Transcript_75814:835-1527(-)